MQKPLKISSLRLRWIEPVTPLKSSISHLCTTNLQREGGEMKTKAFKLILIICLAGMLLGACSSQTGLEGRWVGCDVRKPLIDWTLTVQGNRFYLVREDLTMWYIGQFSLNNNCLLKKIDLQFSHTHIKAHKERTLLGIYQVEEDILTFITAAPGENSRPLSFDEPQGAVVFNFVRS
jgi:uncharacterized protein (TIGR03067 family)